MGPLELYWVLQDQCSCPGMEETMRADVWENAPVRSNASFAPCSPFSWLRMLLNFTPALTSSLDQCLLAFSKLSGDCFFPLALLIPGSGLFWNRLERFMLRAIHQQCLASVGPALCPLAGRPPAGSRAGAHRPHSQISADFHAPHFLTQGTGLLWKCAVCKGNHSVPL